ncbi:hypothetical protein O3P69_002120 [Scylla paramamosain]|uniref:FGFR1 oncogene partner 2 homolog n=3 Tax=Scylla TaxID=6760 RepID=A0A0N7ZDQ3_SCYOL
MYDKMSVLQQVLTDARKLATRLRDHDSSADSLLSQAQGMYKHVESMKEYCEEMNELNEAANNRPRSALIHSIQQENKHIRQLQQENKELRLALEEHQNVMELIMSKYRQQVAQLVTVNSQPSQPSTQEQAKLSAHIERVSEMVAVMRKAAALGDDESNQQQRLITALATENKGLREMLNIASRSGSLQLRTNAVDAGTQTGQDSPKLEEGASQDVQEEESASIDTHKSSVS